MTDDILEKLLKQEETLQFQAFNHEIAWKLGIAIKEKADSENKQVAIDITANGQPLFFYAMKGTTPDNIEWMAGKMAVVRQYGHSSFYISQWFKQKNRTEHLGFLHNPRPYAPHGGCFPLIAKNFGRIGTITVSGLPSEQDHQLIVDVLTEFITANK
ncbi:MAG: heme-degrading domain-containing protein [SAR324 cluster bacterium]|nr:heme-degrading domain-containing protein [SAR324 cluster bacterium]